MRSSKEDLNGDFTELEDEICGELSVERRMM